jgi:hypothetical protein
LSSPERKGAPFAGYSRFLADAEKNSKKISVPDSGSISRLEKGILGFSIKLT